MSQCGHFIHINVTFDFHYQSVAAAVVSPAATVAAAAATVVAAAESVVTVGSKALAAEATVYFPAAATVFNVITFIASLL